MNFGGYQQLLVALLLVCDAVEGPVASGQDAPHQRRAVAPGPQIVATSKAPENHLGRVPKFGLTRQDVQALAETLPELSVVVPVREVRRQARFGDQVTDVQLLGVTPQYRRMHRHEIRQGRFFTEVDERQSRNVAVIGKDVGARLFLPGDDPIGKKLRIGRNYFTVVGLLQETPTQPRRDSLARTVCIPLSTMRVRCGDLEMERRGGAFELRRYELSRIEIRLANPTHADLTAGVVQKVLDSLHDDSTYVVERRLPENLR